MGELKFTCKLYTVTKESTVEKTLVVNLVLFDEQQMKTIAAWQKKLIIK